MIFSVRTNTGLLKILEKKPRMVRENACWESEILV